MRENFKKIAIIKLSALGDIVHSVIVLQFIKKHIPNIHITWIVDRRFSGLLEAHSMIDELVLLPLKDKKFKECFSIIKNLGKFDIAIDLQGLLKSAIITKMLSKNSFGFDKNSVKERVASLFYKHKFNIDYAENIIVRNLSLVAFALGFKFSNDEILAKQPCFDMQQNGNKNGIIITPFASENSKCYNKFKEVINLLKEYEIKITQSGENELKVANEIAKDTHAKVLERMNLREIINLITNSNLVIGNDSGITHIAWAVNTPSITLFGNRPSNRNAYKTPINLTIDTGKNINARKIDKSDFCIREILPETIANTAKRLLNG